MERSQREAERLAHDRAVGPVPNPLLDRATLVTELADSYRRTTAPENPAAVRSARLLACDTPSEVIDAIGPRPHNFADREDWDQQALSIYELCDRTPGRSQDTSPMHEFGRASIEISSPADNDLNR